MKFGIFDNFGALNSSPVFAAFRDGLDLLGFEHASHDISADVAVIWSVVWNGRMRHNRQIWEMFRSSGRPVIVLEVGSLQRGTTWKVGVNGTGVDCYNFDRLDLDRPKKLGLHTRPWNKAGKHIVIALQRSDSYQWIGQPTTEIWIESTYKELRSYTDRPIVIRQHPRQKCAISSEHVIDIPGKLSNTYDDFNFIDSIQDAWAVINHNSGLGVQSVISGVPTYVDRSSLAYKVGSGDLSSIEFPKRPNRDQWMVEISHTEWTNQEISDGLALRQILPLLDDSASHHKI